MLSLGDRSVEEVATGWTARTGELAWSYLTHLAGSSIAQFLGEQESELTSYARDFAQRALRTTGLDMLNALEHAGELYASLGPILDRRRVLLCPTVARPSVAASHDPSCDALTIEGEPVDPAWGWVMTYPFNMQSRCPVLAIPAGRASNGVPIGIQIVGRTFCDGDVFRAALAYEEAAGSWFETPERRPHP